MSSSSTPRLILASASPRRRDLLAQIGLHPVVVASEVDETPQPRELPATHVQRLARAKAAHVASGHPDAVVIAADTAVACGRRLLPKADDEVQARACLKLLSGRRHRVYGGICAIAADGRVAERLVVTSVVFRRFGESDIERYIAGGEWRGKAGGYAIQGSAAAFVRSLTGSYTNVVGLDLYSTASLLRGVGFAV
jgi:septum formation protein